jgi:hypothetical protein
MSQRIGNFAGLSSLKRSTIGSSNSSLGGNRFDLFALPLLVPNTPPVTGAVCIPDHP